MPAPDSFTALDSGVGFLSLADLQSGLPSHFDLMLRQEEINTLFLELDADANGVVKYAEWDAFYR